MLKSVGDLLAYALPFTRYPARGTSEPCNLCGASEARVVANWDRRLKRMTTVICEKCGLVRTDPMPTDEELDAYYASHYRLDYQLAGGAPPRFHRVRAARRAAVRAAFLGDVLFPGARVLDFGSGAGEFLAAAKARGCYVLGVEPGREFADYARKAHGVAVLDKGWREIDLPARSFDVVTAHHVLEHLRRPVDALRMLAAALADGGVLYVSVPDVSAGANPAYERFHFAHVHGFSPATVRRAGRAAGLVPDERFAARGATLVLRKRRAGDALVEDGPGADEIFASLRAVEPLGYIIGLGFLGPMIRRNLATLVDTFRRAPR